MTLTIVLYILLALLIPLWIFWNFDPKRKRLVQAINKIPGPLAPPLIGNAYDVFTLTRENFFAAIDKDTRKYWPIYRMWTGPIAEVNLSEADHIEKIFRSSVNIDKAEWYKFLHPWLGTGLLTSEGQKWHSRRKLLTPTFHFKILECFQDVFARNSQILVKKLGREIGNSKGFDVYPYITLCALDIICETAMGTEIHAQDGAHSQYVTAIYDASELSIRRIVRPWLHSDFIFALTKDGKRYNECLKILHSFTNKIIEERKLSRTEKPSTQDEPSVLGKKQRRAFLDLLLEAEEDGAKLTSQEVREEVDTFMFEGHDTTSASLCWTLFLLGNHPDVQERAFEEQTAIFGDSDRQPNIQDLAEMKYLERVIKESLRLYPSVPFIARRLTEDVEVGEYLLPATCQVNILIYYMHRNPKYFPDPETFNPDNFLPENVQGRHPFAYVPFSAGSRNCIGQKFALLEEKTVLSAVMRQFRVRALDAPKDVNLMAELVLRPANGIRLVIERR